MMDDDKPDIEVGPLAAGCFSSCGASCLFAVLVLVILSIAGVEWSRLRPDTTPGWVKFFGFWVGLGSEVLGGYVAAHFARQAKKLHALILGMFGMVVGVLGFVSPAHNPSDLSYILAWLLSVPLSLLGANLAIAIAEQAAESIAESDDDERES